MDILVHSPKLNDFLYQCSFVPGGASVRGVLAVAQIALNVIFLALAPLFLLISAGVSCSVDRHHWLHISQVLKFEQMCAADLLVGVAHIGQTVWDATCIGPWIVWGTYSKEPTGIDIVEAAPIPPDEQEHEMFQLLSPSSAEMS